MSDYYAVVRSKDYLLHYGVRGMKWGVRRAIERGNDRALHRNFMKAQRKLSRLNRESEVKSQEEDVKKYEKRAHRASVGAKIAGTIAGTSLGIGSDVFLHKVAPHISFLKNVSPTMLKVARKVAPIAGGAAALGLGAVIYNNKKMKKAENNATKSGHKDAVARRDEWHEQMNEAFKGTRYDSNKRRNKKNMR